VKFPSRSFSQTRSRSRLPVIVSLLLSSLRDELPAVLTIFGRTNPLPRSSCPYFPPRFFFSPPRMGSSLPRSYFTPLRTFSRESPGSLDHLFLLNPEDFSEEKFSSFFEMIFSYSLLEISGSLSLECQPGRDFSQFRSFPNLPLPPFLLFLRTRVEVLSRGLFTPTFRDHFPLLLKTFCTLIAGFLYCRLSF